MKIVNTIQPNSPFRRLANKNKQINRVLFTIAALFSFQSCDQTLELQDNYFGSSGSIVINAYAEPTDTVQITLNDSIYATFTKKKTTTYQFVKYFEKDKSLNFNILNKITKDLLHTYSYQFIDHEERINDTVSFYYKSSGIWIDNVLSDKPGTLSKTGNTGYRFIFPNINHYSHSGYTGAVDAILKRYPTNVVIDTIKNIGADIFSEFVEFEYAVPPIVSMQLVKHGTSESYLTDGGSNTTTMSIESGKSKLVVIEEIADKNGSFSEIKANIDLTRYFDY